MESTRISDLSEELVRKILLRLRVKALLRCKCVCKQWCGLIGSRSFIDAHSHHESNPDFLLIQNEHNDIRLTYALYKVDERHMLIEESNHQLLMPTCSKVDTLMGPANGIFFCMSELYDGPGVLLNPAMREFKPLPPLPLPLHKISYGFGSDPISGDLKVVAFQRWPNNSQKNCAFVYSLSSGSWKIIGAVDLLNSMLKIFDSMCNTFVNGVCHWTVELVNGGGLSILAFDMRTESFQEIQVPDGPIPRLGGKYFEIAVYCDSLALLLYDVVGQWVMGKQGFWSKSFKFGPFEHKLWPRCVWKNNEVLSETETVGVILCDFSTQKVRYVRDD